MKKWNDPKLITLALLFLFLMILLLAFQGGSGGGDHEHIHVAIGNKDISMARKLKHLKPKTQLLKPINPKKKNEFEYYSDQGSNDLLEGEVFVNLMAKDYQGPKGRKAPVHN